MLFCQRDTDMTFLDGTPVCCVQLSKGISVVEALPSVHTSLLGPRFQCKVPANMPL